MRYAGQCHCGKLKASFETQKTPHDLGVRACQCAFCRRHGAVNVTDPEGAAIIDAFTDDVERYRFSFRTGDFLFCRRCGVYIAAVMGEGEAIRASLNVAGLRMEAFLSAPEAPATYGAETTEARIARRLKQWTPTRFLDPALDASYYGPH